MLYMTNVLQRVVCHRSISPIPQLNAPPKYTIFLRFVDNSVSITAQISKSFI